MGVRIALARLPSGERFRSDAEKFGQVLRPEAESLPHEPEGRSVALPDSGELDRCGKLEPLEVGRGYVVLPARRAPLAGNVRRERDSADVDPLFDRSGHELG